jgi:hypothetical protein
MSAWSAMLVGLIIIACGLPAFAKLGPVVPDDPAGDS